MALDRRHFIKLNTITAAGLPFVKFLNTDLLNPDGLASGFIRPPDSSKPWVFWIWYIGKISVEGITRDLEEMKRQGIGGVLIYNLGGGGIKPGDIKFLSPEWRAMFRHALMELKRLNIHATLNFCDGWDSGGPWIDVEHGNKKLAATEFYALGGQKINRQLATPVITDGYYRDVAVLAIPAKKGQPLRPAEITASSSFYGYCFELNRPPHAAADGDPDTFWAAASGAPAWISLRYNDALAATGVHVVATAENGPKECELQRIEGTKFTTISKFGLEKGEAKQVNFPETSSKEFRLLINSAYGTPVELANIEILRKGDEPSVKQGIKWWDQKSGARAFWDFPKQGPDAMLEEYTSPDDGTHCKVKDVLDISAHMDSGGNLSWDAPVGDWNIIRYGYTSLGQKMGTTVQSGYEADMLSSDGIDVHFKNISDPVLEDVKTVGGNIFDGYIIDSYEIGRETRGLQPNWSAEFRAEFKAHRGYDMLPFMPALSQRIIESREVTNRFLWDVRRTIADLFAERFWKRFRDLAHAKGMQVQSETGYGSYPYPHIDSLQCAGYSDVPMSEFWYNNTVMSQFNPWGHVLRTVSAAAHIYGHKLIQTEAFTSYTPWASPAALKPLGDEAFCAGVNRMLLQQFTHQPIVDDKIKPGNQFGAGTHIDRNLTWWKQSPAFFTYLGRCQHLLQQGLFVADVVYFYGEGAASFVPGKEYLNPPLSLGYDCDTINADVLINRISVKNGRLVLPDGMSYRLLVIRAGAVMSVKSLQRIKDLVAAGATVIGTPPEKAPGLTNYPHCDTELKKLVSELWADCDGKSVTERRFGKGRIICGKTPDEVLRDLGIHQDFEYSGQAGAFIDFIHRSTANAEIYFIANRKDQTASLNCTFRVAGRPAEIWDPVSGDMHKAAAFKTSGNCTTLPLTLAASQSLFIVFRKQGRFTPADKASGQHNFPNTTTIQEIKGSWQVHFDPKWGGPAVKEFTKLDDWTTHTEEGIKHYSGTATYVKHFDLNKMPSGELLLDLGIVKDIAQVRLNGKELGVLWTAPWQVDITKAVKQKGNILEIDVINQWPNRIIGDRELPADKKFTHTNAFVTSKTLMPSGLMGPVTIKAAKKI